MTTAQPLTTQAVVSILKRAGLDCHLNTRRDRRDGYAVRKVNRRAIAVEWCWSDRDARTAEMETVLTAAGMKVVRPFPDKTILGVTR